MIRNSQDVMTDIESVGKVAGSAILSIGATTFDGSSSFYEKVSLQSCIERGLKEDPETMAWWHRQEREVREEAFSGTLPLEIVLGKFSDWFRMLEPYDNKKIYIWANGADFDLPIIKAAYHACYMVEPWVYSNTRCYRTLKNLYREILADDLPDNVKHHALWDAKYQAAHARKIIMEHFRQQ